jgi:hypothetical protein
LDFEGRFPWKAIVQLGFWIHCPEAMS